MDPLLVTGGLAFAGAGACYLIIKRMNKAPRIEKAKVRVTNFEYDYLEKKFHVTLLNTSRKVQDLGTLTLRQMVLPTVDAPEGMMAGNAVGRQMFDMLSESEGVAPLEPCEERRIEFSLMTDYNYGSMDVEVKGNRISLPNPKLTSKPFSLKTALEQKAKEAEDVVKAMPEPMEDPIAVPLPLEIPEPPPLRPIEKPEGESDPDPDGNVCKMLQQSNSIALETNWKDFTIVTMDRPQPIQTPTLGLARILEASGMSEKELIYLVISHLNQEQVSIETRIASLEEFL